MKNYIIILLGIILGFSSCKKSGESGPDLAEKKESMLSYVTDDVILVHFDSVVLHSQQVAGAAEAFHEDDSPANLDALKEAWLNTEKSWQLVEMYNFGNVKSTFLYAPINRWAADTTTIKEYLDSEEEINENFVNWKGSSSKGLAALEYLIYTYDTDNNESGKQDYILAIARLLNTDMNLLQAAWEDYAPAYQRNQLTGVNESLNLLINSIIAEMEFVSNTKVGKPLGKSTGTPEPETVESPYAEISLQHIEQNIKSIGAVNGNIDGGLYAYLTAMGKEGLVANIEEKYLNVVNQLDKLSPSLKEEIESNPEKTEQLYSALKDLLVVYKVDVSSALSVTVTFTDNDGD